MKLIILDRDGVINHDSPDFIKSADEWLPLPGSIDAIADLSKAGWTIVVTTNQSGIGRGLFSEEQLVAMHQKMRKLVAKAGGEITAVYRCPHAPEDGCECRKPKAGLIDLMSSELGYNPEGAITVGDSLRDLQAGAARGCKPILVLTGKGEKTLGTLKENGLGDIPVYDDLSAVAKDLLRAA